jgi:integrase
LRPTCFRRLAAHRGYRAARIAGDFTQRRARIAKRLRQTVGQVFRCGIVTGRAKRDASVDLKGALKASGRQAHQAMLREDLPEFLRALSAYDGAARTRLALRLAVLTFVRTTELRAARWDEVDLEAAEWRIPAERMKMGAPHIVSLSRQVVETFAELRSIAGRSDYVFPSPGAEGFMSNNTMLFAMYRMGLMVGRRFTGSARWLPPCNGVSSRLDRTPACP